MKNDNAVIDILSCPRLHFLFEHLKTNKWKDLSDSNKKNFYLKVNELVCDRLDVDPLDLVVGDGEINENTFLSDKDYKNLIIDREERPYINDVNYNQYLTLYEYFFRLRVYILQLSAFEGYNGFFDAEKKKKIDDNYRHIKLGGIYLKYDKDDGEEYEDYQYVNKEAREFAETIMFKIVRDNYVENDCYDEEFFMANYNVLVSDYVNSIGEDYLDRHFVRTHDAIYKLKIIKDKLEKLEKGDLKAVNDEDLFFIVYPAIINNSDPNTIIRGFNEIIKRIYGDRFKILWKKDSLVINNNFYSTKDMPNLLNIVLYECLNDMNDYFGKEMSECELVEYKKKWILSVVRLVDSKVKGDDFGVFKYQSIYRLLNKKNLENFINKTDGNYFPLKNRGNI